MKLRTCLSDPKVTRYSLPILLLIVLVEIILGNTGIVSRDNMAYFLFIPAVLELTFIVLCLMNLSKIIRRYQVLKKEGQHTMDAWQQALELIFPPRLARLALIEPRLYYALYLSFKRKRKRNDTLHFATRLENYEFLVKVIIVLCAIEVLGVSIMLPSRWMVWKLIHLILGLWAILWLWADFQAMLIYSHHITAAGIRFRMGLRCCQEIRWEYIAACRATSKVSPSFSPGPYMPKDQPGHFYLAAGEKCNIEIELRYPQCFLGMFSDIKDVTHLYLSLESPNTFMDAVSPYIQAD